MSIWMLVEDEPDVREVLETMFQVWGVDGIAFVDGLDAITWIESADKGLHTEKLPNLAILDIRLPKISGIEVAARLRRSKLFHSIPILLITAYRLTVSEKNEVLRLSRANHLLHKPFPPMDEFREILDGLIAGRKFSA